MSQTAQASIQPIKITPTVKTEATNRGILIAFAIIGTWAISLVFLLSLDISNLSIFWMLPVILLQTFLYTGLFITAHDAMHGVVYPQNIKINNFVGTLAVLLYAIFPYEKLRKKHWLHHHNPASETDPDFHNCQQKNFFAWYFQFMKSYWNWKQVIALTSVYYIAVYLLHLPENNLTLFWIFPSILSSAQLFYFGTFLPHREPEGGYQNIHRATTNPLPVFLSFITCYHFGYHEEHHEYPHVPWWNLPVIYQRRQEVS